MMMNLFVVWLTDERRLGTIVRDPYHRESPTLRDQDLNLRRTWVQDLMSEVSDNHYTTVPQIIWDITL